MLSLPRISSTILAAFQSDRGSRFSSSTRTMSPSLGVIFASPCPLGNFSRRESRLLDFQNFQKLFRRN
uniref:Candidate secreted effector n=1 Tax=Meloidogyne incognita TaxID=6306 RepID=A0A914LIF4_MELIC